MPNTKGENLCGPEWNGEPLPRFNKFSEDGGGGSSWPIWDGTLGTFCNQTVANNGCVNQQRVGSQWRLNSRFYRFSDRVICLNGSRTKRAQAGQHNDRGQRRDRKRFLEIRTLQ